MKMCCLLVGLFLCIETYGNTQKPCEMVGYDRLIGEITRSDGTIGAPDATSERQQRLINLFKHCIHTAAVCMVELDLDSSKWLISDRWINKQLTPPINGDFDPVNERLIFGLLQFIDEKTGSSVCIVAKNSFARAIPWYGSSWVISDKDIKEYEIYSDKFTTVMTPNSLYNTLLEVHQEAVAEKG